MLSHVKFYSWLFYHLFHPQQLKEECVWGCGCQCIIFYLCCSFFLMLFPCFSASVWSLSLMIKSVMSCSITSWVFRLQFLLDDQFLSFPHVAASFRPHPCAATWGLPWAAVCRSALKWYPTCYRGTTWLTVVFTDSRAISAQVPGTPPPLLHHWFWDLQSCFSHSSLSRLLHSILFPFLNILSQGHHQHHSLAQLWLVEGPFWSWLELALWATPDLSLLQKTHQANPIQLFWNYGSKIHTQNIYPNV